MHIKEIVAPSSKERTVNGPESLRGMILNVIDSRKKCHLYLLAKELSKGRSSVDQACQALLEAEAIEIAEFGTRHKLEYKLTSKGQELHRIWKFAEVAAMNGVDLAKEDLTKSFREESVEEAVRLAIIKKKRITEYKYSWEIE